MVDDQLRAVDKYSTGKRLALLRADNWSRNATYRGQYRPNRTNDSYSDGIDRLRTCMARLLPNVGMEKTGSLAKLISLGRSFPQLCASSSFDSADLISAVWSNAGANWGCDDSRCGPMNRPCCLPKSDSLFVFSTALFRLPCWLPRARRSRAG